MNRPVLSVVAVTALLVLGAGVARALPGSDPRAATAALARAGAGSAAPVELSEVVCPGGVDTNVTTEVTALGGIDASGAATSPGAGPEALTARTLAGSTLGSVSSPGIPLDVVGTKRGALVVTATGAMAPGMAAGTFSQEGSGAARGLSGTACLPAGTDFWFVGPGTGLGQRPSVYLTNPTDAPAALDLDFYGPAGPVESLATRGVTVAPHAQKVVELDAVVPDIAHLAVHVVVSQGRVEAAVRDLQINGLDAQGADWVPESVPPAKQVIIPLSPGGGGLRELSLVAPGSSDATVAVHVVGASGSFVPVGAESLTVPAGGVLSVDASKFAGTNLENLAIVLSSNAPITAGLLARRSASGSALADLAWSSAAAPLSGPAVVPSVVLGPNWVSELMLLAPKQATSVRLELRLASGTLVSRTVSLPSEQMVTVRLEPPPGVGAKAVTRAAVVLTPVGTAPVLGAAMVTERTSTGPLFTISPLTNGTFQVNVPSVRRDLSAGVRAGLLAGQSSSTP